MQMTPPDPLFTGNPVAVPAIAPMAANTPQSSGPAFDALMTQEMADRSAPETPRPAPAAEKAVSNDAPSQAIAPGEKAPQQAASTAPADKSDAGKEDSGGASAPDKVAQKGTEEADAKKTAPKSAHETVKEVKSGEDDLTKAGEGVTPAAPVEPQPVAQAEVAQATAQPDIPANAQALAAAAQGATAATAPQTADTKDAPEDETALTDVLAAKTKGHTNPSAAQAAAKASAAKPALLATPALTKAGTADSASTADEAFVNLLGKAVKGVTKSSGGETQDETGKDGKGQTSHTQASQTQTSQTQASQTQTGGAEPKTAEAKVKSVLDAFQAAVQGTAQADASAGSSDAARTQPQAATPAADTTTSTAFSLQSLQDTPGSYSAMGSSAAAASNMSKAAVETLSALSMQISKRLSEGNTKFAIELHPADLGKVEVTLNIARDGKTTAHLRFDTPITAAAFSSQEGELRQQLAQTGLTFDKDSLSFSSRDGGAGFGASLADQQGSPQSQSQARQAARALEAAGKAADEIDTNAALDTALANFRNRSSHSLALNLIV